MSDGVDDGADGRRAPRLRAVERSVARRRAVVTSRRLRLYGGSSVQCPRTTVDDPTPRRYPASIPVPERLAARRRSSAASSSARERRCKLALACLLARGHLLIEDIPGVGKSTLAQALAGDARAALRAHPVHQRPAARGRARRVDLRSGDAARSAFIRDRSSIRSCSPTKSTARRRRRRARCSRRWRSGRSRPTARRGRCPSRSSSSPRRIRPSRSARTRCPSRSSTAS